MGRFNTNNFIEACLIANIMCKGGGEQQVHCTFQARKNKAHSTLFHQQILPSPLPLFRRKKCSFSTFQRQESTIVSGLRCGILTSHICIHIYTYTHTYMYLCISFTIGVVFYVCLVLCCYTTLLFPTRLHNAPIQCFSLQSCVM